LIQPTWITRKRKEIRREHQGQPLKAMNKKILHSYPLRKWRNYAIVVEREAISCLHEDSKVNQEPNGLSTRLQSYYMFIVL
jgi:hypothetical protein